jgi:ribosome-binding factor A
MQSRRQQRVRELLIHALSEILRREFPVNETGLITVNDVGVANDLHSALVFVSLLGSADQQQQALALLNQNQKRIQGLLARAVVLKYTPQLKFSMDESITRGNRVLAILEEIEKPHPPT